MLLLLHLSKLQLIILAIYFLSLAYCCVWVPWSIDSERLGYGWIWAGPQVPKIPAEIQPLKPAEAATPADTAKPNLVADFSDIDEFVAKQTAAQTEQQQWEGRSVYAVPYILLMKFRVAAASLIFIALLLLAGLKEPATRS